MLLVSARPSAVAWHTPILPGNDKPAAIGAVTFEQCLDLPIGAVRTTGHRNGIGPRPIEVDLMVEREGLLTTGGQSVRLHQLRPTAIRGITYRLYATSDPLHRGGGAGLRPDAHLVLRGTTRSAGPCDRFAPHAT